MPRFGEPEALQAGHDLDDFDCGTASLNVWLRKHALQARAVDSARTFVVTDAEQDRVVGFHALTGVDVAHDDAASRARKGMPRHPIPAALLARLAVDVSVQGRGLGAWLLQDAMRRVVVAAESVGIRVLLVHALDERARSFSERHGFEVSPTDPLNLQILVKDQRRSIEAGA